MTRTSATLAGLIAAVSASALLAAGPSQDAAAGTVSPFDPAAAAETGIGPGHAAPGAGPFVVTSGTRYFPAQFPDRGRAGAQAESFGPTF